MCKIRTGAEITKISDIQNMITGYMLRQTHTFVIEDITDKAKRNCVGCQIQNNDIDINSIIESMAKNTLMSLLRNEYIERKDQEHFIVNVR